jgi:hypothetical protein
LRPPTIEGRHPAELLDSSTQASTEPGAVHRSSWAAFLVRGVWFGSTIHLV